MASNSRSPSPRRLACFLAVGAVAGAVTACADAGAPNPNSIDALEFAAVRLALDSALGDDTAYTMLRPFVLQYVDRAAYNVEPAGDTTRLTGIQFDIDAELNATPIVARLSAVLAWRGYDSATRTVDSVVLVVGTGIAPPLDDSLQASFDPDVAGTGTAFIIAQAADSSVQVWSARTGAMRVSAATFGKGSTQSLGGLALTLYRGTLVGDFHLTGKLRGDTTQTAAALAAFPAGIPARKIRITGSL